MKKLFYWMLKRYSQTEKGRINIIRILDEQVQEEYCEQTIYGNVYNHFIEFAMANPFIVKCALRKDEEALDMLKKGIDSAFDRSVEYIQKEMK